jgi:hypothetical protein
MELPGDMAARARIVNHLRSLGIDSQPGGPVRQSYLSYWPGRLHRLAESIPRLYNRLQIQTPASLTTELGANGILGGRRMPA